MADRFMRIREVMRLTGLARSTIFLMSSTGRFPKQIPLGCAASGWLESEVVTWCDTQIRAARGSDGRADLRELPGLSYSARVARAPVSRGYQKGYRSGKRAGNKR
jgi:prophage regulatory protein